MTFSLKNRQRGMLEMSAAMVLSGTLGYFVVSSGLSSVQAVFYRCLLGAFFLGLYCVIRGYITRDGFTRNRFLLCILCGIAIPAKWVMLFSAYKMSSIFIATAVYHTQPFLLLLLGVLFLHKRFSVQKFLWIILAFIGVILAIDLSPDQISLSSVYALGLLLSFGAALLYAIVTLITMRLTAIRPHLIALIQMTVGSLILVPFMILDGVPQLASWQWHYILLMGGLHTAVKYILLYSALHRLKAPLIAILSFIYPAVAIVVDYVFLDQALNAQQIFGVVLIVLGGTAIGRKIPFPYVKKSRKIGRKKPPKSRSLSGV